MHIYQEVNSNFITANEIADICKISISKSYEIIRQLNEDLKAKGKYTIRGKVNRKFFEQKFLDV